MRLHWSRPWALVFHSRLEGPDCEWHILPQGFLPSSLVSPLPSPSLPPTPSTLQGSTLRSSGPSCLASDTPRIFLRPPAVQPPHHQWLCSALRLPQPPPDWHKPCSCLSDAPHQRWS